MVRTKMVAVLLGPSGVGLVGLYASITGLVSTLAQLGINESGVRQVAEANQTGDPEQVARVTKTLRRVCWITGFSGWLLTAALAWPLSKWTFGSPERMWPIAFLGATVLITAVTGGQTALLQGMRRIGDLARIQVLSAVLTTLIAIGLYAWLREDGILPVIILTAIVPLGFSWYFSRQVTITDLPQSWSETAAASKQLISLGAAFMYGALLSGIVGLVIRSIIVRDLGLETNGIFQAALAISGMFAGFILGAMGTDFYPRLTAVAHDDKQVNKLVNEQTEIGILLALPGLLGTLVFAPLLMRIFFTAKFLSGAELLPWFVIGVLGQVLIFPIGMIARAKGAVKWIYMGQTWANLSYLAIASTLMASFGILGIAYASPICISLQSLFVFFIARHLSAFRWCSSVFKLVAVAILLISAAMVSRRVPDFLAAICIGTAITAIGCLISMRGIASRLGQQHRIIKALCRLPGGRIACGYK
jgi:antigen flippase